MITLAGARVVAAGTVMAAAVIGLVAVRSPLAAIGIVLGFGFLAALLVNRVAGLALFTLMIFFGQLGNGASLVKLAGLVLALGWALSLVQNDRPVPFLLRERPTLAYLALGLAAWSAFSMLWAPDGGAALSTASRVVLNVLLFLIVFSTLVDRGGVRTILIAYVTGSALTSLWGLASGTTHADSAAAGRLGGGIGDPNELAALILPGLVFAVFLLVLERGLVPRLLLCGASLVFLTAIFMTQSRGGIVALGVALLGAMVFGGPLRGKFLTGGLGLGAVAVIVFVFVAPPTALGRIGSFSSGGGTGRLDLWTVAVEVIRDHPWVGVGAGNFTVVEPRYAAAGANLPRVDLVLDAQKVTHNTYLNIFADLGIVGLLAFVGLVVGVLVILVGAVRRFDRERDPELAIFGRATLISILAMLAAFTFISAQYEKQLWLLLGIAAAIASLAPRREPVRARRPVELRAVEAF